MGSDRGVDLSRRAINAVKTDLEEALALLRPDSSAGSGGEAQPVLTQSGPAGRLSADYEAVGGLWPAAMGYQQSTRSAVGAVTGSYENIGIQVENVLELLKQALQNYDCAEQPGESSRQV
jgi:hypothetical protein